MRQCVREQFLLMEDFVGSGVLRHVLAEARGGRRRYFSTAAAAMLGQCTSTLDTL